jgi:hypothetical protein
MRPAMRRQCVELNYGVASEKQRKADDKRRLVPGILHGRGTLLANLVKSISKDTRRLAKLELGPWSWNSPIWEAWNILYKYPPLEVLN